MMLRKLDRLAKEARLIKWITVISLINFVLYFLVLLYLVVYFLKLSKLKREPSLLELFSALGEKRSQELRAMKKHADPITDRVAVMILEHRSMVALLLIVGTIIAILTGVILFYYQMGYETGRNEMALFLTDI
jgi:hypothetical protein